MDQLNQEALSDHQTQFLSGVRTFSLLFTRWMDTNGWSHPKMVALATACMGGTAWLHSSQISGLRHAKLLSPGPRTFIAIERLNFYLHRYATTRTLIPGTSSSNHYAEAYAVTEDGDAPSLGWWVEVFCGYRNPRDIDLRREFFTDSQARDISAAWGALVRKLMTQSGIDLITDLDRVLRLHYPAKDASRLEQTLAVIQNRQTWTADQLANELPAISALTADLGGPRNEDDLLDALKR
jgi:hypothetical protein